MQTSERVCAECGLVLESSPVDLRGESVYDANETRGPSRLSHAPAVPGFRTFANHRPVGLYGVSGSDALKRTWRRVAAADRHDLIRRARHLRGAYQIRSAALELGLPPRAAEEAMKLLVQWRASDSRRVLPKAEIAMSAVLLYVTRRDRLFINSSRILRSFGLHSRFASVRAMTMMERDLRLVPVHHSPDEIISHLVREFGLPPSVGRDAAGYVRASKEGPYMPQGVAGGAVYMAARQRNLTGVRVNQETIATACGVTAVTIRNHYHKIAVANGVDPEDPTVLHGRYSAPGHNSPCAQWAALVGA
jgi:transcription initiation factor TFIIIB Brf1 subunit/transcription initiation factor TFIIB